MHSEKKKDILIGVKYIRLRQKHSDHFKRVDLFYCVCQLLGSYHFRTPVRKYILEIFDMRFTPELLQELDNAAMADEQQEEAEEKYKEGEGEEGGNDIDGGSDLESSISNEAIQEPSVSNSSVNSDKKKVVPRSGKQQQIVHTETLEPVSKQIGFDVK